MRSAGGGPVALDIRPMQSPDNLGGGAIFLSGSIPDRNRWDGEFHPLEITDAVVAFARACLTSGYRIVTAAHPTLAPLLLYVAAEFPETGEPRVVIYQSLLFDEVLPEATRRFESSGVGRLIWTEAAAGEEPLPERWTASLASMRLRMLEETSPLAAVFIGGMDGIRDEFMRFTELYPTRPTFGPRRPGGEAARLHTTGLTHRSLDENEHDTSYPTLWSRFLREVEATQNL